MRPRLWAFAVLLVASCGVSAVPDIEKAPLGELVPLPSDAGSPLDAGGTPDAGPVACTTDVANGWPETFVRAHCSHCHYGGYGFSEEAHRSEEARARVTKAIADGGMPKDDGGTPQDLARMLKWLDCGAP